MFAENVKLYHGASIPALCKQKYLLVYKLHCPYKCPDSEACNKSNTPVCNV